MQLCYYVAKYANKYAGFLKLVRGDLPMLEFNQPRVYEHFVDFCASKRWADEALQVGAGPIVVVTNTCNSIRGAKVAGFTERTRFPDRVFYEEECVLKYQANPVILRREMESLILHECIHWARLRAKVPHKVPAVRAGGEAGNEFEWACYGMDMSARWNLSRGCL